MAFSFCPKPVAVAVSSPKGRKLPQKLNDFDPNGFIPEPSRSKCVHVCVCVCVCVCWGNTEVLWEGPRLTIQCLSLRYCVFTLQLLTLPPKPLAPHPELLTGPRVLLDSN